MGAYPENLYDGHTLRSVLQQVSKILGFEPEMMICVLSYRWYNDKGKCNVQIVNRFRKRISCSFWSVGGGIGSKLVIGHGKREHRMDRNQLCGNLGDKLHVIL